MTESATAASVSKDDAAYFSCQDMHSYYGESYIVQGVSFDVKEGEIIALLGRNGAGKTSTLRSIARASSPEVRQGEIWLAGNPLHRMSSYQAAQLDKSRSHMTAEGRDDLDQRAGLGCSDRGTRRRGSERHQRPDRRGEPSTRANLPARGVVS